MHKMIAFGFFMYFLNKKIGNENHNIISTNLISILI